MGSQLVPVPVFNDNQSKMSWQLMTDKSKKKRKGAVDKEKLHQLKKHFDRADKDKLGEISKEDWFETLTAAGLNVNMVDVEALFEAQDRDLDGKLSWEEFCGEQTATERAFLLLDPDRNGKISKQDFHKLCQNLSMDQVEAAFARFDISGDEQLDYKEFCNMMKARDKSKRKSREQSRGERRK